MTKKRGEKFVDCVFTLLLMIDKKGEKDFGFICMFCEKGLFMHICFVLKIGEKDFDLFYAC